MAASNPIAETVVNAFQVKTVMEWALACGNEFILPTTGGCFPEIVAHADATAWDAVKGALAFFAATLYALALSLLSLVMFVVGGLLILIHTLLLSCCSPLGLTGGFALILAGLDFPKMLAQTIYMMYATIKAHANKERI